jgi:hypothetical protein
MKNETKTPEPKFDFFRLSCSKDRVDLCSNTLRHYNTQGLKFYKIGKSIFVSYSELEQFIRDKSEPYTGNYVRRAQVA